jgi:hypothetical protein
MVVSLREASAVALPGATSGDGISRMAASALHDASTHMNQTSIDELIAAINSMGASQLKAFPSMHADTDQVSGQLHVQKTPEMATLTSHGIG